MRHGWEPFPLTTWRVAGFLEEGTLTSKDGSIKDQDEPKEKVPLESWHLNARIDLKVDVSVWEVNQGYGGWGDICQK